MSNEFVHTSVGATMTQAEFELITLHQFNSQATGDVLYASSGTQLSRLAVGSNNDVLHLASGIPAWSATLAGVTLTAPVINGSVTTTGLTLPAITLSGIVTGGSQVINSIGHIGIATASSATRGIYYVETYTNPQADRFGLDIQPTRVETSTNVGGELYGERIYAAVGSANSKNWTASPVGLIGINLIPYSSGGSGTITGATCLRCNPAFGGAGLTFTNLYDIYIDNEAGNSTLTNQYGIYMEALTGGATLNYAIFTQGGLHHFGDFLDFTDEKGIHTGTAADDYFTLTAYDSTGGTRTGMEAIRIQNNTTTPCKMGFYGTVPVDQPATIADAAGCAGDADDKVNLVIDLLQEIGLMA